MRLPLSIVAGLTNVRLFVIYHDFQHDTILKGSAIARALMTLYGLSALNPPSIWRRSHNHHHKNNAKIFAASIGSFPVMTTEVWDKATFFERMSYRIIRHPLTIAGAYVTVFLFGMTIRPLLVAPRQHFDCAISLIVHGLLFAAALSAGWDVLLYAVLIPCALASTVGAYLFYAQHNFPSVIIRERTEWDHVTAALQSSSYIAMSPIMAWFTGNIGYHHVHHLNHRIPFYRLPQAMAGLDALQLPSSTSLYPWDIRRCLNLLLWDPGRNRLITLAEHRAA